MPKFLKMGTTTQNVTFHDHFENVKTHSRIEKYKEDLSKSREKIHYERNYVDADNLNLGARHRFEVQRSEQLVSDFWLELQLTDPGVLDVGDYSVGNFIDTVEIRMSGKKMMDYSGRALNQYLFAVNKTKDQKEQLIRLSNSASLTGAGGDIGGSSMWIPIVTVGQTGIVGHENEAFAVGRTANDLEIIIKYKTAALIDVNGIVALSRNRLWFKSWATDSQEQTLTNPQGLDIVRTYQFIHILDAQYSRAQTADTEDIFNIKNSMEDGEMNMLLINAITDANRDTNFEHSKFEELDQLILDVRNKELYTHESALEGEKNYLEISGNENKISLGGTKYSYYVIDLSVEYDALNNLGSVGTNLFKEEPKLKVKQGATDTLDYCVTSIVKANYVIRGNGRVDRIINHM